MLFGDFAKKLAKALEPDPPKPQWFLVNFRVEKTGEFAYAILLLSANSVQAGVDAYAVLKPETEAYAGTIDVPSDKLPDESYRNRKLTRDEIQTLWQ